MKRKKSEHVPGAWAIILAFVAYVFGCGITGADPHSFSALALLYPFVLAVALVFVIIIGLVGGFLGCGKGK